MPVPPVDRRSRRGDGHVARRRAVEQPLEQRELRIRTVCLPALHDDGVVAGGRIDQVDFLSGSSASAGAHQRVRRVEHAHVEVVVAVGEVVEQREPCVGRSRAIGDHLLVGVRRGQAAGTVGRVVGPVAADVLAGISPRGAAAKAPSYPNTTPYEIDSPALATCAGAARATGRATIGMRTLRPAPPSSVQIRYPPLPNAYWLSTAVLRVSVTVNFAD